MRTVIVALGNGGEMTRARFTAAVDGCTAGCARAGGGERRSPALHAVPPGAAAAKAARFSYFAPLVLSRGVEQ